MAENNGRHTCVGSDRIDRSRRVVACSGNRKCKAVGQAQVDCTSGISESYGWVSTVVNAV